MRTCILLFALLFLNIRAFSQDWLTWSFQYDFTMEQHGIGKYDFDSVAVWVNVPFEWTTLRNARLEQTPGSSSYRLTLDYGCISCGWTYADQSPTLFFQVYLTDRMEGHPLSIWVPVLFDPSPSDTHAAEYQLGVINFNDFIYYNDNYHRYEGIRVDQQRSPTLYDKGKYEFPRTDKLIRAKHGYAVLRE